MTHKYFDWLNENKTAENQYLANASGEKRKKKKDEDSETEDYEAPEHVVQPAKDDKGFFMYKKAFDRMKSAYTPGIRFSFADNS